MTPEQALACILDIAKNAVLIARSNGPMTGLTFQDHAVMQETENIIRRALAPKEASNDEEH